MKFFVLPRTLRFLGIKTCEPTEELGGWLYRDTGLCCSKRLGTYVEKKADASINTAALCFDVGKPIAAV
jgi:hypothetical protein